MPVLDFRCTRCNQAVELLVPMSEPNPTHHAGCGGELRRDFSAGLPGTVYKGNGWAKRDRKIRDQI
jgi:putative FmdB family regulatory protein